MLACTALVGCTNEDVIDNPNEKLEGAEGKAYVRVKLIMSESTGSRAASDLGYHKGETNEQAILADKSIFLFYDNAGNWVTSGELMDGIDGADGDGASHHDGSKYSDLNSYKDGAYVVLSGPSEKLKTSTQVLTVVNYHNPEGLKQLTLSQALDKIAESAENPADGLDVTVNDSPKKQFLMSTSVYYNNTVTDNTNLIDNDVNGDGICNTTKIDGATQICDVQKDALDNPVVIYIERAAAKVQLLVDGKEVTTFGTKLEVQGSDEGTAGNESGLQDGNDIVIDGKQYPVYIQIEGWSINNVNETTNLVKKIETAWNNENPLVGNAAWSNREDYRSYWAKGTKWIYDGSPTITTDDAHELTAYTYNNALDVLNNTSALPEDYKSSKDYALVNNAMYCYEQTVDNTNIDPTRSAPVKYPNNTTVLIAAKFLKQTAEGVYEEIEGKLINYGGVFYTENNYKNLLLTQITDYWKLNDDGTYSNLAIGDLLINMSDTAIDGLTLSIANENGTYKKGLVKDANGTITNEGETTTTTDILNVLTNTDFNTSLDGVQNYVTMATVTDGGKCYYQIPIEHFSSNGTLTEGEVTTGTEYLYGVVRNHWYQLNITKVARIGELVYNPDLAIPQVPTKETSYYLAAELHVLSWHVVGQDVTLE